MRTNGIKKKKPLSPLSFWVTALLCACIVGYIGYEYWSRLLEERHKWDIRMGQYEECQKHSISDKFRDSCAEAELHVKKLPFVLAFGRLINDTGRYSITAFVASLQTWTAIGALALIISFSFWCMMSRFNNHSHPVYAVPAFSPHSHQQPTPFFQTFSQPQHIVPLNKTKYKNSFSNGFSNDY